MSESETDETERKRPYLIPVVLALLLILYPLSIGPVVWLYHNTDFFEVFPEGFMVGVERFYLPVDYAAHTEFFGPVVTWYVELWMY